MRKIMELTEEEYRLVKEIRKNGLSKGLSEEAFLEAEENLIEYLDYSDFGDYSVHFVCGIMDFAACEEASYGVSMFKSNLVRKEEYLGEIMIRKQAKADKVEYIIRDKYGKDYKRVKNLENITEHLTNFIAELGLGDTI